jgi:hypothetical protein
MHVLGAQLDSGMNYDSTQMRAFTRQTRDDPVEYAEGPFVPATDGWVECRFSGRDIRLRVEGREDAPWSVGRMRFDAKPGGGR